MSDAIEFVLTVRDDSVVAETAHGCPDGEVMLVWIGDFSDDEAKSFLDIMAQVMARHFSGLLERPSTKRVAGRCEVLFDGDRQRS